LPVRIAIGLAVTVIALASPVAGSTGSRGSSGRPARPRARCQLWAQGRSEVTEVAGQRKLLKWTVPGLAHFFTMWGFTILLLTIIEAYGSLFVVNFHIPGIGQWAFIGFIEDFFAVAVLVSLCVFTAMPHKNAPVAQGAQLALLRLRAPSGVAVLAHDRGRHHHAARLRAAQVNTRTSLTAWAARSPPRPWRRCSPSRGRGQQRHRDRVLDPQHRGITDRLLGVVAYSSNLHIFLAPINARVLIRRPPCRWAPPSDKTPDMDMENISEDTVFGVGLAEQFTWKQMLDFSTCTSAARASRCARRGHRQAAVAQARDQGAPGQHVYAFAKPHLPRRASDRLLTPLAHFLLRISLALIVLI